MASNPSDTTKAWTRQSDQHATDFKRQQSPKPLQALAIFSWVVGFILQAAGVLSAAGKIPTGPVPAALVCVVALIADVVLVLWGASLWRKAGVLKTRMAGAAEIGPGLMRVALSSAAFIPMALFFLAAKNASAKAKLIAVVCALISVAVIVLLAMFVGQPSA